jgi:AraC-like DNA-binding protein
MNSFPSKERSLDLSLVTGASGPTRRGSWKTSCFKEAGKYEAKLKSLQADRFAFHAIALNASHPLEFFADTSVASILAVYLLRGAMTIRDSQEATCKMEAGYYRFIFPAAGVCTVQITVPEIELVVISFEDIMLKQLAATRPEIQHMMVRKATHPGESIYGQQCLTDYRVLTMIQNMRGSAEEGIPLMMDLEAGLHNLLNYYRKQTWYGADIEARKGAYYETIQTIRQEIESGPNKQKHTLNYFARNYAMSMTNLKRFFKRYMGIPLHVFVTGQCMELAGRLSQEERMTIEEIRETVGYSERSGFIRAYKKHYGFTPKRHP